MCALCALCALCVCVCVTYHRLAGSPMAPMVQMHITRAKARYRALQGLSVSFQCVLQDNDFMTEVLAFYRYACGCVTVRPWVCKHTMTSFLDST